jgi:hypothetical protein
MAGPKLEQVGRFVWAVVTGSIIGCFWGVAPWSALLLFYGFLFQKAPPVGLMPTVFLCSIVYFSARVLLDEFKKGCDLRLMSPVDDVDGIPTAGKNLIIVAAVNVVLHVRIFDSDGKVDVNTDENRLTAQGRRIEDLTMNWPIARRPG